MPRRLLAALLFTLALLGTAGAQDAPPPQAHPALWKVTGRQSVVYLFGSVHVLSPALAWRDARIDEAIGDADVFYFEADLDPKAIAAYVADRGMLAPGQSLRAMLPADSQQDLDADMASIGVAETGIDSRRPWLASIAMTAFKLAHDGDTPAAGVDAAILADAQASGKPIRYFETLEQQMALLAPSDPKMEMNQFEVFLKEFRTDKDDLDLLLDAWASGDPARLTRLLFREFDKHPGMRKLYFDDRNIAWVRTLEGVLESESGTVLVTVGAGHLLGRNGLVMLLKRAGYKVERL